MRVLNIMGGSSRCSRDFCFSVMLLGALFGMMIVLVDVGDFFDVRFIRGFFGGCG